MTTKTMMIAVPVQGASVKPLYKLPGLSKMRFKRLFLKTERLLSTPTEATYISRAKELQNQGRKALPEEYMLLQESLKAYPQSFTLNTYMAINNELQDDVNEGLKFWLKCANLKPNDQGTHYALAIRFEKRGEFEKALQHYNSSVFEILFNNNRPFYYYIYSERADLREKMGDTAGAEQDRDTAKSLERECNKITRANAAYYKSRLPKTEIKQLQQNAKIEQ
jgi:tetratricopeptide (TPR) repeat protein